MFMIGMGAEHFDLAIGVHGDLVGIHCPVFILQILAGE